MLAAQAGLAGLACRYDPATHALTVTPAKGRAVTAILDAPDTHPPLFDLLGEILGEQVRGPLRIVHAPGQAMTDIPEPHLSLISAASVRALSARTGMALDPVRFRGNLLIDGLEAWSEFGWVGHRFRIGDAVLTARARIGRCAATGVDPVRGVRDIDLPRALFDHYGHTDCGLYCSVDTGGHIAIGDEVMPPDTA